jgi:hypothetical protein
MKQSIIKSPYSISIFKDSNSFNCFSSLNASTNMIKDFDLGIYCDFNITRKNNNYFIKLNTFHTDIISNENRKVINNILDKKIRNKYNFTNTIEPILLLKTLKNKLEQFTSPYFDCQVVPYMTIINHETIQTINMIIEKILLQSLIYILDMTANISKTDNIKYNIKDYSEVEIIHKSLLNAYIAVIKNILLNMSQIELNTNFIGEKYASLIDTDTEYITDMYENIFKNIFILEPKVFQFGKICMQINTNMSRQTGSKYNLLDIKELKRQMKKINIRKIKKKVSKKLRRKLRKKLRI